MNDYLPPKISKGVFRHIAFAAATTLACLMIGYATGIAGVILSNKPTVAAAIPAAALIIFLYLQNPERFLLALLLLRAPLDPILEMTRIPLGGASTGLGGILNFLIIFTAITIAIKHRGKATKETVITFGPFLVIYAISFLRSPLVGDALRSLVATSTYASMFLIGYALTKDQREFTRNLRIIVYSSIIPIFLSLISLATGTKLVGTESSDLSDGIESLRFSGPFAHPNILAFYALLITALSTYISNKKQNPIGIKAKESLLITGIALLNLVLIASTKTRSAWAATAIFFSYYASKFNKRIWIYILLLALAALAVPDIRERILDLQTGTERIQYEKLNSYAWRKLLWQQAFANMTFSQYFVGHGLESFKFESTSFFSLAGGVQWGAHSVFVQLIYEVGAIGLLAFLWIFARIYKQLPQKREQGYQLTRGITLSLIACFLMLCYSDNTLNYLVFNLYFWFFLGVVQSFYKTEK